MRRKFTVTGTQQQSNSDALNVMSSSITEMLTSLGFQELRQFSGAYAILDETQQNIICYDDDSGTFSVLEGGALDNAGATFLEYVNDKDGWEIFLENHPSVRVVHYPSLEEALGW